MFNYIHVDESKLEFTEIAPLEDLPVGDRLYVNINGKRIVLLNLVGKYYAIGDICTHDGGPLGDGEVEGNEIICPRHGARFNIENGKAVGLPAVVDIPSYPVRINQGKIEIGIPLEE